MDWNVQLMSDTFPGPERLRVGTQPDHCERDVLILGLWHDGDRKNIQVASTVHIPRRSQQSQGSSTTINGMITNLCFLLSGEMMRHHELRSYRLKEQQVALGSASCQEESRSNT